MFLVTRTCSELAGGVIQCQIGNAYDTAVRVYKLPGIHLHQDRKFNPLAADQGREKILGFAAAGLFHLGASMNPHLAVTSISA